PFDDAVTDEFAVNDPRLTRRVAFTGARVDLANPDYAGLEPDQSMSDDVFEQGFTAPGLHVLFLDWEFSDIHRQVEGKIARLSATEQQRLRRDWPWLEDTKTAEGDFAYRVPARTEDRGTQLASLASDLMPDFVHGAIEPHATT